MEGGPESSNSSIIISNNSVTNQWRAEEAIAGNARALQTLRELITYPILYSRESRCLGLKVHLVSKFHSQFSIFSFDSIFFFFSVVSWFDSLRPPRDWKGNLTLLIRSLLFCFYF